MEAIGIAELFGLLLFGTKFGAGGGVGISLIIPPILAGFG
jgi:hypothetical protein